MNFSISYSLSDGMVDTAKKFKREGKIRRILDGQLPTITFLSARGDNIMVILL
jgi:hypothetical protein